MFNSFLFYVVAWAIAKMYCIPARFRKKQKSAHLFWLLKILVGHALEANRILWLFPPSVWPYDHLANPENKGWIISTTLRWFLDLPPMHSGCCWIYGKDDRLPCVYFPFPCNRPFLNPFYYLLVLPRKKEKKEWRPRKAIQCLQPIVIVYSVSWLFFLPPTLYSRLRTLLRLRHMRRIIVVLPLAKFSGSWFISAPLLHTDPAIHV